MPCLSPVVLLLNTTNSPRIGALSSSSELFTVAASSGYIRFANNSQMVTTTEPDSGVSSLVLTVERSGSFGSANLIWSINAVSASFVPTQDVIIQSGTVTIAQGTKIMLKCSQIHMHFIVHFSIVHRSDEHSIGCTCGC